MWNQVRVVLRSLRRSPAFALTVIATLGIGIGLNAAIFTVVDCVLLRPLGYRDADRIVGLGSHFIDKNRSIPRLGGDDYADLARQVKGLESTAYYQNYADGILLDGASVYLPIANVSPAFGQVLGVEPVAGRLFATEDARGRDALVSASFARDHFGSTGGALGRTILYGGELRPIVGVLPNGFSFPGKTEVWFERNARPEIPSRTAFNQQAIGKLRSGVSLEQLNAELAGFSGQLQKAYPEDRLKTIEALPLRERIVGKIRPTLNLLMGAVAVILLIVAANVTHLQLVRATRDVRAVTIRTALGASRSALAGRAFLEAVLLAAGGCAFAIVLAVPALRLLVRLAPPEVPRLAEVHLNVDVLLFSLTLSVLLMAVTAVLPVWRSWRLDPASALRQDASRGTEGRGTSRLRDSFLVAEVALTLVLSVAAVMLARQLLAQSRVDLGFTAEHLAVVDTHSTEATPPPTPRQIAAATPAETEAYLSGKARTRLAHLDATLETVGATPGVNSVAAIDGAPMGFGGSDVLYAIKGRQTFAPGVANMPGADIHGVTPGLFSTLQIPLLRGRGLTAQDTLSAPMVLLVNRELARQVFPGQEALGQQIMCGYDEHMSWWTIVGVVGDIRSDSPGAASSPTMYVPLAQHPGRANDVQIVVRTAMEPRLMLDTLRYRLRRAHPEVAVKATTMRESIGETQRAERFRGVLFGSFAGVSILLAAVGMYGVTAYSVAQRRFEFGLRLALGAGRMQLLGMVLRKSLLYAGLGIAIGAGLSVSLTRVLGSVLGKLPPFDAPAYALASIAVLAIALLATLGPAQVASDVEPNAVLRGE